MRYEYDEVQQTVVHKVVRPSDVYWEINDKKYIIDLLSSWKIVDFRLAKCNEYYIPPCPEDGVKLAGTYYEKVNKGPRFIVVKRNTAINDFPEWE